MCMEHYSLERSGREDLQCSSGKLRLKVFKECGLQGVGIRQVRVYGLSDYLYKDIYHILQ
jgi:hypothetical protein